MAATKRVRIIKKIRQASGVWRFISMARVQDRYVWDKRPGYFFVEWWEGKKRRREIAGRTPSEAAEAQRRKRNELIGELVAGGADVRKPPEEGTATAVADATEMFLDHVRVHSPDKPRTHRRYEIVLQHFGRILAKARYVEALTRADIDNYKTARSKEGSEQHKQRAITPRTVNFEVSVLRTFFYFLINERGLQMENPCARFKLLKDQLAKANRRPPTYTQAELDCLFAGCDQVERTIFATLLLTGLREQELYFLAWPDVQLAYDATVRVHGEGKEGFSPKDYEERILIPQDLSKLLSKLPRTSHWVFPSKKGGQLTHLLRRLKEIAEATGVASATLHKFRHTYATRLLERGCDIVTVQRLMGHSDLDTTRQYLNPDESLKRAAVNRLTLGAPRQVKSSPKKSRPSRRIT